MWLFSPFFNLACKIYAEWFGGDSFKISVHAYMESFKLNTWIFKIHKFWMVWQSSVNVMSISQGELIFLLNASMCIIVHLFVWESRHTGPVVTCACNQGAFHIQMHGMDSNVKLSSLWRTASVNVVSCIPVCHLQFVMIALHSALLSLLYFTTCANQKTHLH